MRLSEHKRTMLYDAISDRIMELRIEIKRGNLSEKDIDDKLFNMEIAIWKNIKEVLNLDD